MELINWYQQSHIEFYLNLLFKWAKTCQQNLIKHSPYLKGSTQCCPCHNMSALQNSLQN